MKTGDLVVLSARGRKANQNSNYREGYGIILMTENPDNHDYPFKCHWFGLDEHINSVFPFKRYEIKKLKAGA